MHSLDPHKPRVLFVLKFRQAGGGYSAGWSDGQGKQLSSGLLNSARMVADMLLDKGVETKVVHVVDANAIHREVVLFGATHVIVEAFWVTPEKFDELHRASPAVQFIVRNHSETPFLANEGMAFDWILEYAKRPNVAISCNAPRMLRETRLLVHKRHPEWSEGEVAAKVPYLPNFYDLGHVTVAPVWDDPLHVGCFGAVRPLKNHLVQAIAAIEVAERLGVPLHFHINASRVEMNGAPILRNLRKLFDHFDGRHVLIEQVWRPHHEFRHVVRSMDIVTQVSFSETFNIVAADAVSQGVPTVTSKEISWASGLFRADPTSSRDIAEKMYRAYKAKRIAPKFNPSLAGLRSYNAKSVLLWLRQFGGS